MLSDGRNDGTDPGLWRRRKGGIVWIGVVLKLTRYSFTKKAGREIK